MKRYIAILVLLVFFHTETAHAFDPIVTPTIAIGGTLILGACGGGIYYGYQKYASSTVNAAGDISRAVKRAYASRAAKAMAVANFTAKLPLALLQKLALKNDATGNPVYPNV